MYGKDTRKNFAFTSSLEVEVVSVIRLNAFFKIHQKIF